MMGKMWIKIIKPEKGKKLIELGKRRGTGDPVYENLNNLRAAIGNLKNSIIASIPICIINLYKHKGITQ